MSESESSPAVRPAREAYWRGVLTYGTMELVAGIELRAGDDLPVLRAKAKELLRLAGDSVDDVLAVAEVVERLIQAYWPGRAYFIEVAEDQDEGWIQIFQPLRVWREPEDE